MTIRIAAFDVDGTLTQHDCVVPFIRRVAGTGPVVRRLAARPHLVFPAVVRRDRDGLKALAADAAFRGRSVVDVQRAADAFASDVAADRMRADTMQTLTDHHDAGDVIVLVSASFEVYLRPLGALIGASDVLAARLETHDDVFTGQLNGPNCRGPEKVVRLHEWLGTHHGGRAAVHVTAYGDSTGDRELLQDADVAHWVGSRTVPAWFPVSGS